MLDQTGLAQKGGAVTSHLRIARMPAEIAAVRLPPDGADLILGCDIVVAAGVDARLRMRQDHTAAVVNSHEGSIAEFTHDAEVRLPVAALLRQIADACGTAPVTAVDASRMATELRATPWQPISSCSASPASRASCRSPPRP